MIWPAVIARIRITRKRTRKIKNRILEICAARANAGVTTGTRDERDQQAISAHFNKLIVASAVGPRVLVRPPPPNRGVTREAGELSIATKRELPNLAKQSQG
jgi:hypothetical protein